LRECGSKSSRAEADRWSASLADASLHGAIVTGCLRREPAIDFLSAHEASLEGVPYPEVLAFATRQDRILVTSGFKTMPRHFGNFLEANGHCAGVFLVKQRAPWPMSLRRSCWYGPLRTPANGKIGLSRFLSRNREPPQLHVGVQPRVRIPPEVLRFGSPVWTRFELLRPNWPYDRTPKSVILSR
jgi:hypothetical protein